jgi:error-prone DNA polymerase
MTCRYSPRRMRFRHLLATAARRCAKAVAAVPGKDMLLVAKVEDETPEVSTPSEADDIVGDYRFMGLTLGRHPLELLRASVGRKPSDVGVHVPVIYITLDDETGNVNVNVIVWPKVLEQQRNEVLAASLLGVLGVWQREGEVLHLVAQHLIDMSHLVGINEFARFFFERPEGSKAKIPQAMGDAR